MNAVLLVDAELALDLTARRCQRAGIEVYLPNMEFKILQWFMEHPRQAFTRRALLRQLWGYEPEYSARVVDVTMSKLRGKIGAGRITTVRGYGYRFDPLGEAS